MGKEVVIALISCIGTLLAVALKGYWDTRQARRQQERSESGAITAAEIEDRSNSYNLLITAYNQMLAAERAWTQKEIEMSHARFTAEERLSRREDEHKRDLREVRGLTEEQHLEIIKLQAELEVAKREIERLRRPTIPSEDCDLLRG